MRVTNTARLEALGRIEDDFLSNGLRCEETRSEMMRRVIPTREQRRGFGTATAEQLMADELA